PPHCYTLSLHDALPISFRVADFLRYGKGRRLAAPRDVDRLLRGQSPRVEQIEVGLLACEQLRIRQSGAFVFCGMARDSEGGIDRDRKSTRLNSSHVAIS